LRWYASRKSL
jgi:ribosomal protein S25